MRKEIIGVLLSGVAIIALSGCSSKPVEDTVDIEELHEGYEIVFEEVEGVGEAVNGATHIQDPQGETITTLTYTFCPWESNGDKSSANAETNVAENSGIYMARGPAGYYDEGSFYMDDGTDIGFNSEDKKESKNIQPLNGYDYYIETENGSLKVGGVYPIDSNDHEVLEINFDPEACNPV